MAVRSFLVRVHNKTSATLRRSDAGVRLYHGIWSGGGTGIPSETISAFASDWFQAESDGFATGVDGLVTYAADHASIEGEDIYIEFASPFLGSRRFRAASSWGPNSSYLLKWGDPGGVNAQIDLDIHVRAPAAGDCNLGVLWGEESNIAAQDRNRAFQQMSTFRDNDFSRFPGLAMWWAELQSAFPDLATVAEQREDVRVAVDALLSRVDWYLNHPEAPLDEEDIERIRIVLVRLGASSPELSKRFVEHGLRVLALLSGRSWLDALAIASSATPHADT